MPRPRRATVCWTIAKMRVSRYYGGPEEGGWYYDAGEVEGVYPYEYYPNELELAQSICEQLNAEEENTLLDAYGKGRYRGRHSAAPSEPYDVVWMMFEGEPEDFPKEIPHYE
jgi:hypothetical protein